MKPWTYNDYNLFMGEMIALGIVCLGVITFVPICLLRRCCMKNIHTKCYYAMFVLEIILSTIVPFGIGLAFIFTSMFDYVSVWIVFPLVFTFWLICFLHLNRRREILKKMDDDLLIHSSDDENDYEKLTHTSEIARIAPDVMLYGKKYDSSSWFGKIFKSIKRYPRNVWLGFRNKIIVFCLGVVFIGVTATLLSFFTTGCCAVNNPYEFSTTFTRRLGWSKVCSYNSICRLYFTVPEDMSTSLIVNFHVYNEVINKPHIKYDTKPFEPHAEGIMVSARHVSVPVAEETRYQAWTDLTGLTPNTTYYIVGAYTDENRNVIYSKMFKVRTLPAVGEVGFINGGDIQWNEIAVKLAKLAAQKSPYFALLGGDIAYDNGILSCYRRWDWFFKNWMENFVTPTGHSVPIATAIGNHEIGGWQTLDRMGFYRYYFPQKIGVTDYNTVSLYRSYNVSDHTLLLSLDSFVAQPLDDRKQLEWLSTLKTEGYRNKIAAYHTSLYPSMPSRMVWNRELLVKEFGPIFDKMNLQLALEHHYHCFKRTYRIRANKVDPTGTYYLGDGSFGVNPKVDAIKTEFIDKIAQKNYLNYIVASSSEISVDSFDENGASLDSLKI